MRCDCTDCICRKIKENPHEKMNIVEEYMRIHTPHSIFSVRE